MNSSKPSNYADPLPRFSAVAAGHACLDILPDLETTGPEDFKQNFRPGHTIQAGKMVMHTGGSVSNTGLALLKLGVDVNLICKIGNDQLGTMLCSIYKDAGVKNMAGIVIDPHFDTSYTVIINPRDVDRIFLHYPGANQSFAADDVHDDVLKKAGLFHFGYPPLMKTIYQNSGKELTKMYQHVKGMGLTTSLDLCVPDLSNESGKLDWHQILSNVLPYVDLFLPSLEEVLFMLDKNLYIKMMEKGDILAQTDDELIDRLTKEIIDMGSAVAMIKVGSKGIYLRTAGLERIRACGIAAPDQPSEWADQKCSHGIFPVKVAGTTGAGDCAIAGFLSAWLRGLSPADSITMACAAGACNCEQLDATSGLIPWEEMRSRINSGWK